MKKIKIENILCVFIILCPILDMISFIFRNTFETNLSPSTITRPLIPVMILIYLFFKNGKKLKINIIIIGLMYLIYGITHIYLFRKIITRK